MMYLGVFPTINGSREYRILEISTTIVEYDFSSDPGENMHLQDCDRLLHWVDSPPYKSAKEAIDSIAYNGCIYRIEYDRPLPNITKEEANQELKRWWDIEERKFRSNYEERERNTKMYYVMMPVRVYECGDEITFGGVEPTRIKQYCYLFGGHPTIESAVQNLIEGKF